MKNYKSEKTVYQNVQFVNEISVLINYPQLSFDEKIKIAEDCYKKTHHKLFLTRQDKSYIQQTLSTIIYSKDNSTYKNGKNKTSKNNEDESNQLYV